MAVNVDKENLVHSGNGLSSTPGLHPDGTHQQSQLEREQIQARDEDTGKGSWISQTNPEQRRMSMSLELTGSQIGEAESNWSSPRLRRRGSEFAVMFTTMMGGSGSRANRVAPNLPSPEAKRHTVGTPEKTNM